jgi:hypothetical protein
MRRKAAPLSAAVDASSCCVVDARFTSNCGLLARSVMGQPWIILDVLPAI